MMKNKHLPPNTSQVNVTMSPSIYGPTTLFRSIFASSLTLILSGGTITSKIIIFNSFNATRI